MNLTKEDIKYISQNMSPQDAQYVMGVSTLMNDIGNQYIDQVNSKQMDKKEFQEIYNDVLLVNKLVAYCNKFLASQYACKTEQYKFRVQDFQWLLKDAIDNCMRLLYTKYGDTGNVLYNLPIPAENDPLTLINDLREIVYTYVTNDGIQENQAEDRVLNMVLNDLLKAICKAIYDFRLAKCTEANTNEMITPVDISEMPEECVGVALQPHPISHW